MSRGRGFVPWWRLARLPGLVVVALRRDRPFRWASAGAGLCLALLLGRLFGPPPDLPARQGQGSGEVPGLASEAGIPPPFPRGPLPSPEAPATGGLAAAIRPGTAPPTGPIAPGLPLGPSVAPRDSFGTLPAPRIPAP